MQDRQRQRRHRGVAGDVRPSLRSFDRAVGVERRHELAHEQRVAAGALRLLHEPGSRLGADQARDERRARARVERSEGDARRSGIVEHGEQPLELGPSRLRPCAHDQRHGQALDPARDPRQHAQGRGIRPVEILDRQHDRRARAEVVEHVEDRLADAELALGSDVQPGQLLLQPLVPAADREVDDRTERAVRLELLGLGREHHGVGGAGGLERRLDEARLADPGLALDDGHPPAAAHLAHDLDERRALGIPPHERGLMRGVQDPVPPTRDRNRVQCFVRTSRRPSSRRPTSRTTTRSRSRRSRASARGARTAGRGTASTAGRSPTDRRRRRSRPPARAA